MSKISGYFGKVRTQSKVQVSCYFLAFGTAFRCFFSFQDRLNDYCLFGIWFLNACNLI